MKKESKAVISLLLLTFGALISLMIGCLALKRGNWAEAIFLIVISITMTMWSHGLGIRKTVDERFERLEKLLYEHFQTKKSGATEKDIDRTTQK